MKTKQGILITLGLALAGTASHAQGGFTLFGDSGPSLEPEQKFVRPLTAPYFHEDSFITTDLRAWHLKHHFYGDTINGDVTVTALQARLALTQSLQLVAYKDGYTKFDGGAFDGSDGFNDIGAGIKWAFLQDWENQFHMAAGIGYEFGWGDDEVLQDTDELRLWLSANKGFGPLHLGAVINYIYATDDNDGLLGNNDMVTVHFHADYYLTSWFSPVIEINGYFAEKTVAGLPFSGVDAVSLPGGADNDTWTYALGAEFRPFDNSLGLRVAYEDELNNKVSLFGHRWTFSAVYEF